ncbi:MAG: SAM-dependent DNA methyltransferase, partial [Anaerolineae bacterium]|nr:SAM-dependent DNA methyltransferase [Anaerolineae bacterium]
GGLNGVHWAQILGTRPDGLLIIQNLWNVGKRKMKRVQKPLEPNLVYPLARGRDVSRWAGRPSAHIIVSQDPRTRMAYEESWMKTELPYTYAYFKEFESELWTRKSQSVRDLMKKSAFYAMYAVADYTFAPYKVVWPEVARGINAAVVSSHETNYLDEKVIIPDHTLILVACECANEAHFVCATLNSAPSRLVVQAYVALHPSPHVLQHIAVPKFDDANPVHTRLAALSQQAHELAAAGDEAGLAAVETEVDQAAAELWGITDKDLKEIRRSLEELS